MSPIDAEPSDYESLTIDDDGIIRLIWPAGVKITGSSARSAFDAVNQLSADTRRPMLVDMATTKSVAREAARAVFGMSRPRRPGSLCSAGHRWTG